MCARMHAHRHARIGLRGLIGCRALGVLREPVYDELMMKPKFAGREGGSHRKPWQKKGAGRQDSKYQDPEGKY